MRDYLKEAGEILDHAKEEVHFFLQEKDEYQSVVTDEEVRTLNPRSVERRLEELSSLFDDMKMSYDLHDQDFYSHRFIFLQLAEDFIEDLFKAIRKLRFLKEIAACHNIAKEADKKIRSAADSSKAERALKQLQGSIADDMKALDEIAKESQKSSSEFIAYYETVVALKEKLKRKIEEVLS